MAWMVFWTVLATLLAIALLVLLVVLIVRLWPQAGGPTFSASEPAGRQGTEAARDQEGREESR